MTPITRVLVGALALVSSLLPVARADAAREPGPGDVVRSAAFAAPGFDLAADVRQVSYLSTAATGGQVRVGGLVFVPKLPWLGAGRRPIVGYAVGTQGLGDGCEASAQFAQGSEYESGAVAALLAQGYAVAVTDYQGLGTPGPHPYVNRLALGHDVLDSVRAAQRLGLSGIDRRNPVLIAGFSEGGNAAAGALELQPSYAPELKLIGGYAGGVPADFQALATSLQGGPYAFLLMYTTIGMDAAYPGLDLRGLLSERGRQLYDELSASCIADAVAGHPFLSTDGLVAGDRTFDQVLALPRVRRVLDQMKLGRHAPDVPVMVEGSRLDDVIGYDQVMAMARDWCDRGARVQTSSGLGPTHVGAYLEQIPTMVAFLAGRVAGMPFASSC